MAERTCPTCGGARDWRKAYCTEACRPACAAEGCSTLAHTRGWCRTHYSQILRNGEVGPLTYSLSDPQLCVVCGARDWSPNGRRRVCSAKCQQQLTLNGGQVPPKIKQCSRCAVLIDLRHIHPSGRKRRNSILLCDACRRAKYTRHRMSVTELVDRDGNWCGICGTEVDMGLVSPDLFRASVDHVLPFANGGGHDPGNLQLAHLWCNYVKSNRTGFLI